MNEVLAKGIKAKRLLENLCLKLQIKNEALAAIANQLIVETAYILKKTNGILKKVRRKDFLIHSLIAFC